MAKKPIKRVIIFEVRPSKPGEKTLYGTTDTIDNISTVFISTNQSEEEFANTFFHEVTHAFLHWFSLKMPSNKQEELSRTVGNIVAPLFRQYKKGKLK